MGEIFNIFKAAIVGDTYTLEQLINSGLSVNLESEDGKTLLMAAAAAGKKQVILKLIQLGADIHATDPRGINALMIAMHFGHQDVVNILVPDNSIKELPN